MKKMFIVLSFIMFTIMSTYSQKVNISQLDVADVINTKQSNQSINYNANYMWIGLIKEIIKNDKNELKVTVVKSKWINTKELISYNIYFNITDKILIDEITKIGINKKIVFIGQISNITDNEITFLPSIIREI